ncbi:MAG: hypothetical protein RLN60_05490 [Phycisphaerales bacterium]
MPRYDYTCHANGRTVEVSHPMSRLVKTWAEVCDLAGIDAGAMPLDAPVVKELSTGTQIDRAANKGSVTLPQSCACGHAHGCGRH